MTIRDIIVAYLREHGYDGLVGEDCSCTPDDLMWRDGWKCGCAAECVPGRVAECADPEGCESCGGRPGRRHLVAVEDEDEP